MSGESKVQIPPITPAGKKALAEGKTTRLISRDLSPPRFSLRQRGYYPDEQFSDAGDALHRARTRGVLRQIKDHGETRKSVRPIIKAIGRRNRDILPDRVRMGVKKGKETIPTFLTKRIKKLSEDQISDLTKTSLGAESKRKATGDKPRKKNPQSAGKRKTNRKKRSRRRKTKRKRKTRKSHKKKKSRKRRRRK